MARPLVLYLPCPVKQTRRQFIPRALIRPIPSRSRRLILDPALAGQPQAKRDTQPYITSLYFSPAFSIRAAGLAL